MKDIKNLENIYVKYFKDLMRSYTKSVKNSYPDTDCDKSLKRVLKRASEELSGEERKPTLD